MLSQLSGIWVDPDILKSGAGSVNFSPLSAVYGLQEFRIKCGLVTYRRNGGAKRAMAFFPPLNLHIVSVTPMVNNTGLVF